MLDPHQYKIFGHTTLAVTIYGSRLSENFSLLSPDIHENCQAKSRHPLKKTMHELLDVLAVLTLMDMAESDRPSRK